MDVRGRYSPRFPPPCPPMVPPLPPLYPSPRRAKSIPSPRAILGAITIFGAFFPPSGKKSAPMCDPPPSFLGSRLYRDGFPAKSKQNDQKNNIGKLCGKKGTFLKGLDYGRSKKGKENLKKYFYLFRISKTIEIFITNCKNPFRQKELSRKNLSRPLSLSAANFAPPSPCTLLAHFFSHRNSCLSSDPTQPAFSPTTHTRKWAGVGGGILLRRELPLHPPPFLFGGDDEKRRRKSILPP